MWTMIVFLFIYILLKDALYTWKEMQLIDRAMPQSGAEPKNRLWSVFRKLWEKKQKDKGVSSPVVKPEPIIDTGATKLKAGPETSEHKQGINPF